MTEDLSGRNPFTNQVTSNPEYPWELIETAPVKGRNPFTNQVTSNEQVGVSKRYEGDAGRNPFTNQVTSIQSLNAL